METMIPSPEPLTEDQIGKVLELLGARLRKSRLQSKPLQHVLEHQGVTLVDKLMAAITEITDAASALIVRYVTVNRTRSAKEALKATGRVRYVTDSVAASMPNATDE